PGRTGGSRDRRGTPESGRRRRPVGRKRRHPAPARSCRAPPGRARPRWGLWATAYRACARLRRRWIAGSGPWYGRETPRALPPGGGVAGREYRNREGSVGRGGLRNSTVEAFEHLTVELRVRLPRLAGDYAAV